ncbi:RagB/SusD family nutrient uptake outer membrane protein, partial [Chitinophaga sp.]|uniref:RagB/SusD family nutrient uptake outer membrane protein n=1 Tax=Chitinophaga sp. TaxID=1869181 RepID=UPI002F92BC82
MKSNIISNVILVFCCVLLVSGCSKYLDQVPNDRITIEEVFRKKGPSEQFLANVYSYVDDESDQWNNYPWLGNSDEGDITWSKYNTYALNIGNISAGNALYDKWGNYYNGIRSASYFIAHIDENIEIKSLYGQGMIDQYKAEARCLRAYYYFLLMRQYGPVVLAGDSVLAPDAPAAEMQLPRGTFDECVNYVSEQLDQAAAVLPLVPSMNGQASDLAFGRMTRGIALSIKSRLLLYAAS